MLAGQAGADALHLGLFLQGLSAVSCEALTVRSSQQVDTVLGLCIWAVGLFVPAGPHACIRLNATVLVHQICIYVGAYGKKQHSRLD